MTEPVHETLYELFERLRAQNTDPAAAPFDPATSPLHRRAVFLVGAPRSGTTWLHQLLATHPDVATAGESHLFCEGLGELLTNHDDPDPYMKLDTWVGRGELVTLIRGLVDGLFLRMQARARAGATRVLDKTPNHVPHAARLAEVYPDAAFVHIIRDGRDAAASAQDLWSFDESWRTHGRVAARWREAVVDVRTHLAGRWYHEVRYEDLVADTPHHLAAILRHLELEHDDTFVTEAASFGRTPVNVRPSRSEVGIRKWGDLDHDLEREIVVAAGDLLVELGYLDPDERDAILARRATGRGREALDAVGQVAKEVAGRVRGALRPARAPTFRTGPRRGPPARPGRARRRPGRAADGAGRGRRARRVRRPSVRRASGRRRAAHDARARRAPRGARRRRDGGRGALRRCDRPARPAHLHGRRRRGRPYRGRDVSEPGTGRASTTLRLAVLADTHLRSDWPKRRLPPRVLDLVAGADTILHAGDVLERRHLDDLRRHAPLHAVRGNNDRDLHDLPETLRVTIAGVRIGMIHDSGPARGRAARLHQRFPDADVVVFGHSHIPVNEHGVAGQLLFNPGSPTERRRQPHPTAGILELAGGRVTLAEIVRVD